MEEDLGRRCRCGSRRCMCAERAQLEQKRRGPHGRPDPAHARSNSNSDFVHRMTEVAMSGTGTPISPGASRIFPHAQPTK